MSRSCFLVAIFVLVSGQSWAADDRVVIKGSPHTVASTLDRLSDALRARNVGIVARIDHAAGAQKVGQALNPTQLLIFGDPKLGTSLMQSNRKIAIDLPMKILAWEDNDGQVWLLYVKPEALKLEYRIDDRDEAFQAMAQVLEKLTDEAVKGN
jgi:uncharacterized protein (DUF302 family)